MRRQYSAPENALTYRTSITVNIHELQFYTPVHYLPFDQFGAWVQTVLNAEIFVLHFSAVQNYTQTHSGLMTRATFRWALRQGRSPWVDRGPSISLRPQLLFRK